MLIQGHSDPGKRHFCDALAAAYCDGAASAGCEVDELVVAALD